MQMKKLFIVESPGKAKTIKKYLGDDFIVVSTMGHIKDLPSKKLGIEINFPKLEIIYDIMEGKEKVIKDLKKNIEFADEIYLAPDADREGEIIAYHVKELIDGVKSKKKKLVYRVTYNEVSKKAILESIAHKRDIDQDMVSAQQARRVLDRLVGYKVSPVLWRKIAKGLSAGRVQSVALKLVCKRDEEIKNFVVTEYWSVHGILSKTKISVDIVAVSGQKKDILSEKDAELILQKSLKAEWIVSAIKDREKKRKPLAPFITSSLQQTAYNALHYNVQKTMMIAQQLYEGILLEDENNPVALITYMRTDSTRISDEAIISVRKYIKNEISEKYLPKNANKYSVKEAAQDAHEAIRPIDPFITPQNIKGKVKKEIYELYNLIWKRFVASQMEDALYTTRSINFLDSKKELAGKITGSLILFDGFLKIYDAADEEEEEEKKLPPQLDVGQKVDIIDIVKKQHFTQPPARYSEATLVKELEQRKIGRPSTYAVILRTIMDRLYTKLDDKKRFEATKLGMEVYQLLEENMPKIMDYSFTANMEEQLDKIAQGEMARNQLIFDFYNYLIPAVTEFLAKKIDKQYKELEIECPECKFKLLIKWGKTGEFVGCSNFPTCKFTSNFFCEGGKVVLSSVAKNDQENALLDIKCEKCQKMMVRKMGRYGEFIACSGYPECNYILQEKSKNVCPQCNKNNLIKRGWKGKSFWGCQGYPNCKFAINGEIVEKDCLFCSYHFLKEDGTCLNKNCTKK